jgi:hypothetical protein
VTYGYTGNAAYSPSLGYAVAWAANVESSYGLWMGSLFTVRSARADSYRLWREVASERRARVAHKPRLKSDGVRNRARPAWRGVGSECELGGGLGAVCFLQTVSIFISSFDFVKLDETD